MPRMYTVITGNQAVSAAQDLIAIVGHANRAAKLCGVIVADVGGTADATDAQAENLHIRIRSGQTTVGSGGAAVTPVPNNSTDSAAGFTARRNDTTQASGGTIVVHHGDGWHVASPFVWIPPEDMRIAITGSRRLTIELVSTPADALAVVATAYVLEYG